MRLTVTGGYTLMEILIVSVILGVVVSLAVPQYSRSIEKVRAGDAVNILQALREAQEIYRQDHGVYTGDVNALEVSIPGSNFFDPPSVVAADPSVLAQIVRKAAAFNLGDPYTLRISQTGVITCALSSYCSQLGF